MEPSAESFAPWLSHEAYAALPVRERALLIAAYYCDKKHIQEDLPHVNRSAVIDKWEQELHIPLGSPWCGVTVTVCFKEGGWTHDLPENPASTHSWVEWAEQKGRRTSNPQRGDVFVILFTPTTGHMGLYVGDKDHDGLFETIEGNTNDDGSRDGYEMARRERAKSPKVCFISMR